MRILVADDSAIVRVIFEQNLGKENDTQIDSVSNGRKALDKAREEHPDLVILDDDMPEMNGFETANVITSELKIPAIILAEDENAKFDFAKPAAIAIMKKPQASKMDSKFFDGLLQQINEVLKKTEIFNNTKTGTKVTTSYKPSSNAGKRFAVLCVGASTGGPSTALTIFQNLGKDFPLPILYTQHLDVGDDEQMAKWFSETCHNLQFSLAKDGEEALPAHVYMAPANYHLVIEYIQENGTPILHLSDEAPVRFLRPAVDKMFSSAAKIFKHHCLALLLTGMGADGAAGCKKIVDAGGTTIAEDESTCVVFGMPAQAIKMGAASYVLPKDKIAKKVLSLISENSL